MAKFWFKPKKYGWGITPISWEGWLITIMLAVGLILIAWIDGMFNLDKLPEQEVYRIIARFIFDSIVLSILTICLVKRRVKGDLGI